MNKEEFNKRRMLISNRIDTIFSEIDAHAKEEKRVIKVLHNAPKILDRLEQNFEERTLLNKVDCAFLLIATALQLVRIYMLPQFQEKFSDEDRLSHNDKIIETMKKEEIKNFKSKHQSWRSIKSKKGYRSWQEIAFTQKVPYDATKYAGEGLNSRNMHGSLHRVKTLGHDPILGWIFGTCNIITETITIAPEYKLGKKKISIPYIESYNVDMGANFCWLDRTSMVSVFQNTIESVKEDKHRLSAAIFAQGLHLASDQYTKLGLPIPFLSLIEPDKAYDIYKKGYDYLDLQYDMQIPLRTVRSVVQAIFINKIISKIHCFLYNPEKESDIKLYAVKTKKILLYSNLIATSSDIIQTAIRSHQGDVNAVKNFDWGGFFITLNRLTKDTAFIQKVKEEFIFKEWDKIVESSNNIYNL